MLVSCLPRVQWDCKHPISTERLNRESIVAQQSLYFSGTAASSTQQHLILPLLFGHIFILDASRMLESSRQYPHDIQVAHINPLILRPCACIYTTLQDIQLNIGVHGKEERERVSFLSSAIPYTVHGGWELAVGLPFEVLAYVANKGAWLGRCVNPYSLLVQYFQGGDGVL